MALRAKDPEQLPKRLKMFLYGEAGVGKTMAAIQFPSSYLIDCEAGMEQRQYVEAIKKAGSAVWSAHALDDVVAEVRELRSTKHAFRTVTIDPISTIYADAVDANQQRLIRECGDYDKATAYGRHYVLPNQTMKRLCNLLAQLDMNVIMTAHQKAEYANEKKVGETFDGYKKLDYVFDLVLQLQRRGAKRVAIVRKTRVEEFPDGEVFDWSYAEFVKRYGTRIEQAAATVTVATPQQVSEIKRLVELLKVGEEEVGKWFTKAQVDSFEDMTEEQVGKCIDALNKRIKPKENGT